MDPAFYRHFGAPPGSLLVTSPQEVLPFLKLLPLYLWSCLAWTIGYTSLRLCRFQKFQKTCRSLDEMNMSESEGGSESDARWGKERNPGVQTEK